MFYGAFFNRHRTRTVTRSFGTRILQFNRETKLTKTVQNIKKTHGQTNGAEAPSPPEYATALGG